MKNNQFKFLLIALVSTSAFATTTDLFDMADKFDAMDKQDFQGFIQKANTCTKSRDFSCTESELAKATKVANSSADKKMLLASQAALKDEKYKVEQERLAKIRQEQEAERKRIAMEEQAQRREAQRRRAEEEAQESRTNWEGLLAVTGAAVIGATAKNYSDSARSAMVDAWVKDRANAANGVTSNNFESTANVAMAERKYQIAEAEEKRKREQLEQQDRERQKQAAKSYATTAQNPSKNSNNNASPATGANDSRIPQSDSLSGKPVDMTYHPSSVNYRCSNDYDYWRHYNPYKDDGSAACQNLTESTNQVAEQIRSGTYIGGANRGHPKIMKITGCQDKGSGMYKSKVIYITVEQDSQVPCDTKAWGGISK